MIEPQRQSALHRRHLEAGARFESFAGWQLPARYAQESSSEYEQARAAVGISDASFLTKLDLRSQQNDAGPLKQSVSGEHFASLDVPPGRLWLLTPKHALITSPEPILFAPSVSVTDVTSVYSAILLAGPRSREVLGKLTTLNVRAGAMADGAARQTRLAHVNATILRIDHAELSGFLILNTRDVAEHVWDALLRAGSEFGARPFGVEAQQRWLGVA